MRIAALFLTLGLLMGCGEESQLTADPVEIKADGVSTSLITLTAEHDDGSQVYFETDLGQFVDEDGYETDYITRSISGGRAEVELHAGIQPGTATVTATTDYDSTTVTVRFLPLTPSGSSFNFSCEAVNIGALRQPVPDLAVPCHFTLSDREGANVDPRGLSPANYGFIAEAGQVNIIDDGYGDTTFLYTATGGNLEPADVEPIDGEPSRPGDTGGTRNPRDGLVTIVAWVRGEEGFNDVNSNGEFEPMSGETFIDQGEPFIDYNDNGEFDPGGGETYEDINGNGRYDEPNGSWDEDTVIWTTFKLLWTGPMHSSAETSRLEVQGGREFPPPPSGTREVVAVVVDENINPLAATSDNYLTFNPGCYYCTYSSNLNVELENMRGFQIDSEGFIEGNLFNTPTYTITITNDNRYADPERFTISLTGEVTPALQTSDGYYPDNNPVSLELEATLMGSGEW